jgi:hypothetical protein
MGDEQWDQIESTMNAAHADAYKSGAEIDDSDDPEY